jgi:hypothetical protein
VVTLGGHRVAQPEVIRFLSDVANGRDTKLQDTSGALVADGGEMHSDGSVTTTGREANWRFSQAGLHSPHEAARVTMLEDFFDKYSFAPSREAYWRGRTEAGPLDAEGFHELSGDTHHSPEEFVEDMVKAMGRDDFEIQTLAERSVQQFLALAETAADTKPLDEMLASLATIRRAGARPLVTALSSATLAVAPGFKMTEFTGPLSAEESASLAASLINHGDPFSLLAAFELLAVHPSNDACRELGDVILSTLWGEKGSAGDLSIDFCIGAIITFVMTRWRRTFEGWSIPGRRLASLAHAGLICRVFANFQIQRPELLAEVRGWFGPRLRLAGLLEVGEARGWLTRLMIPDAVEGMLLRRFDAVLDRIPEADRPPSWRSLLEKGVGDAGGQENIFLRLPGPLDEFAESGFKRPQMQGDDLESLLAEFRVAPSDRCADMIFRMGILFAPPDENVDELTAVILEQAMAAEGPLRETYQLVTLQLADLWGLADLAEGVADLVPLGDLAGPAAVEQALAIAAAHPNPATRLIALDAHLMRHAQSVGTGVRAASLTSAIEILINGSPSLAPLLHASRICAAMAV